ncbi:MAG TPA: PEP-CTERM sorting domain-containing protein [Terriglobia bacterium]|nr:PEP-CTERM sorting domain-containing protein [Terriglobia bacterium]
MKSRKTVELNKGFNKRWLGYAAAAGAAGVGMLATAPPARADIIFTPTESKVPVNGSLGLDVNHDGTTDFNLTNFATLHTLIRGGKTSIFNYYGGARMNVSPLGNLVVGHSASVARLPFGAFIGSYQNGAFNQGTRMASVAGGFGTKWVWSYYLPGRGWQHGTHVSRHPFLTSQGQGSWRGDGTGYLGFLFTAADGFHYGWASFDITELTSPSSVSYNEVLTGYAYNTVPDASITAGEGFRTPEPGTLGLLALGSLGLGFWRRRKAVGSQQ